jgi:predicted Fe-Mo cluster-binding NifX family protein
MRIAIPLSNGRLSPHFGRCEKFAIVEVDVEKSTVLDSTELPAPGHEPGLLPAWLHERGVNLIIAGGMGPRAQALFQQVSIEVLIGAPEQDAEALVRDYLDSTLATGANVCDHGA